MTTLSTSQHQFPAPYRAPGPRERTARYVEEPESDLAGARDDRRYQRAVEGWMAGRIRKASRHWRPR